MNDNLTEEQQIEVLKKIWKEYGLPAITGVVIAVVVIFGWRMYHQYRMRQSEQASVVYARMMIGMLNHDVTDAQSQIKILRSQFTGTPYATLAALAGAKIALDQKQESVAIDSLTWVIHHGKGDAFKQIARIRLARIDLEQKKPQDALSLLESVNDSSFSGLIDAVKGDAYLQLNQVEKARVAYQAALNQLPESAMIQSLIQMKLADLPSPNQNNSLPNGAQH